MKNLIIHPDTDMDVWPFDVLPHTRQEIDAAIKCERWQGLRRSMKGEPTTRKLKMLYNWLIHTATSDPDRWVQADNYINALLRGGQLVRQGKQIVVQR